MDSLANADEYQAAINDCRALQIKYRLKGNVVICAKWELARQVEEAVTAPDAPQPNEGGADVAPFFHARSAAGGRAGRPSRLGAVGQDGRPCPVGHPRNEPGLLYRFLQARA